MKIYTKTGDSGMTSLFGGTRVSKDDARIEAYGCADELNSCLGIARSFKPPEDLDRILLEIQNDLFVLGADLASPRTVGSGAVPRIEPSDIARLEGHIDRCEESLEPLASFIVPGGSSIAAHLHQARTVCRRAERLVVKLSKDQPIGTDLIVYLNRLSDLLFVMARVANARAGQSESPWKGRRGPTV